jgi:hypothetical protein
VNQAPWLPTLAAAVALLLLAVAASGAPSLSQALLVLAVAAGALTFFQVLRGRRDKYDLGRLREVEEKETVRELLDRDDEEEYDSVHCLHCGTVYSIDFPACPNCGRR